MKSIHFSYDAEGDILEVSFGLEKPGQCTGIELNDNVVVFADSDLFRATGLTLLSYSKLLLLPQINLDAFSSLPEDKSKRLLALLQTPPLSNFLQIVDEDQKFFRVLNPNVQELAEINAH